MKSLFTTVAIRSRSSEHELTRERRVLVEVAIADPGRPNHEVDDSWPTQVEAAFRPNLEVHFLAVVQFASSEFLRLALELDGLLALSPTADNERTAGSGDEVGIFTRSLDRIEDDFKLLGDRDSYQGRLRRIGMTDCPENAKSMRRHKSVEVSLSHGSLPGGMAA